MENRRKYHLSELEEGHCPVCPLDGGQRYTECKCSMNIILSDPTRHYSLIGDLGFRLLFFSNKERIRYTGNVQVQPVHTQLP